MEARDKQILPDAVQRIVEDIEAVTGCELEAIHNPGLRALSWTPFGGGCFAFARQFRRGSLNDTEITRFRVGFEYADCPLDAATAIHEIAHEAYTFLNHGWRLTYDPSLSLLPRTDSGFGYEFSDFLEHIFVYDLMKQCGASLRKEMDYVAWLLSSLGRHPAGLARRIIGIMGWLTVCRCFPLFRPMAARELTKDGLLSDAQELESRVHSDLTRPENSLRTFILSARALGIPPALIEVRQMVRSTDGRWGVAATAHGPLKLSDFSLPEEIS